MQSRINRIMTIASTLTTASCIAGCYTKTVSRSGGFGPRAGEVHEPDAPDNALEDAADILYERDWKRKERDRDDD